GCPSAAPWSAIVAQWIPDQFREVSTADHETRERQSAPDAVEHADATGPVALSAQQIRRIRS
ncbi:MAG: hypothetical protein PHQ28_14600, partial [Mycobacterium sp.]|nr:hypothetical protein [Mycobacterium sp.]